MKRGTMVRFYYPDYISEDNAEVMYHKKLTTDHLLQFGQIISFIPSI